MGIEEEVEITSDTTRIFKPKQEKLYDAFCYGVRILEDEKLNLLAPEHKYEPKINDRLDDFCKEHHDIIQKYRTVLVTRQDIKSIVMYSDRVLRIVKK